MHDTVLSARGYKEVYNIVEEFIASRGRETDALFLVQSEKHSRRGICKSDFHPSKEKQVPTNVLRTLSRGGQSLNI